MGDFFQILRPATQDTTKFKELRPATQLRSLPSVIVLPAFSFTGLVWKGASQLLAQYNFALSANITLPALPSSFGRNFCLCVRHRVGTVAYRYKLWSNVGEVLYMPTQYVNEIIRPNFTLEIWSTPDSTASLSNSLALYTSLLNLPVNNANASVIAGTGVQRIPEQFGAIQPVATNILDYLASN